MFDKWQAATSSWRVPRDVYPTLPESEFSQLRPGDKFAFKVERVLNIMHEVQLFEKVDDSTFRGESGETHGLHSVKVYRVRAMVMDRNLSLSNEVDS
jgi:hypothetical protein